MRQKVNLCMSVLRKWKTTAFSNHCIQKPYGASTFTSLNRIIHCSTSWNQQLPQRSLINTEGILFSPFPDITFHDVNLIDFLWNRSEKWMNKTALMCGETGKSYTFEQLQTSSRNLAKALLSIGLKPGEVIALLLPNIPEYGIAFFGAMQAGLVVTTVNPIFTTDEVLHQLSDCDTVAAITMPALFPLLPASSLKGVILTGGREGVPPAPNIYSFSKLIKKGDEMGPVVLPTLNIDSTAVLAYSSGTTGKPKGVMLTHRSLVRNLQQRLYPEINTMMEARGARQGSMLAILPFFHTFGLLLILTGGLVTGNKVVSFPKFDAETLLNVLATNKSCILCVVPTLIEFLCDHPSVTDVHLSSISSLICGAAPVSASRVQQLLKKAGGRIIYQEGYGLTETSPVVSLNYKHPKKSKIGSCGPPVPNTKVKIVDLRTQKRLGPGKTGEVCVQGPQVMKGYFKDPEATAKAVDANGWLRTGDLGYYDEDGYLYITDRIKELIKVKGYQVSPAELEELLRSHPDIEDAAVIGIPHERAGEVPKAFVVRSSETVNVDDINKFIENKVAPYKRLIGGIEFVDSIPRTASGKVLRRMLRDAE